MLTNFVKRCLHSLNRRDLSGGIGLDQIGRTHHCEVAAHHVPPVIEKLSVDRGGPTGIPEFLDLETVISDPPEKSRIDVEGLVICGRGIEYDPLC